MTKRVRDTYLVKNNFIGTYDVITLRSRSFKKYLKSFSIRATIPKVIQYYLEENQLSPDQL